MRLGLITNSDFQNAFSKLIKSNLPIRIAFKLKGIANIIADESDKYHKLRMDILRKYADKDENGELKKDEKGDAQFSDDGYEKFYVEFVELQSIEVDVPKIKLCEIENISRLTAEDLLMLGDLIEGD